MQKAVIFDVDGVLLELTSDEEELFFQALSRFVPVAGLSRDWNSYRIRNDDDIIAEVLERYWRPATERVAVVQTYLGLLDEALRKGAVLTRMIPGAHELLAALPKQARIGIATANLREAARLRLETVGLWQTVSGLAQGADGGGHKHEILARVLAQNGVPKSCTVYVGDNLNDVEAGLRNEVHFIGFSTSPQRLGTLAEAGVRHTSGDHKLTQQLILELLQA